MTDTTGLAERPASEFRVDYEQDKPSSGMWHCGPNACWITVTHLPTMMQVRVYSGDMAQHRARAEALAMMELMIGQFGAEPCQFPEAADALDAKDAEIERLRKAATFWEDRASRLGAMLEKAPEVPCPRDLALLQEHGSTPGDGDVGRNLQRQHGLGIIPPVSECESGAGAWHRITGGKADFSRPSPEMSVSDIMSRKW